MNPVLFSYPLRTIACTCGLLLAAATAQAALVVTAAQREVSAFTSGGQLDGGTSRATAGPQDLVARSQALGGQGVVATATATQQTRMDPLAFSGSSLVSLALGGGNSGEAESLFSVLFTLTSSFAFSGFANLAVEGNPFTEATFDLDELGSGVSVLTGDASAPPLAFGGTLGPGDYRLRLRASADSIDPNESGSASFDFSIAFTDLGEPPNAVPEPQSLALVAAALAAGGFARRRRSAATAPARD